MKLIRKKWEENCKIRISENCSGKQEYKILKESQIRKILKNYEKLSKFIMKITKVVKSYIKKTAKAIEMTKNS